MGITYNGVDVTSVVYNGNTVNDLIYNGTSVFTPGGGGTPVTELSTTAPSGGDPTLADDEVQYFYTGTSAGDPFTALQKDYGEIVNIGSFTLKGVTWNDFGMGGAATLVLQTSTDNSYWLDRYTMDLTNVTSGNFSSTIDVEARYVRLRMTSFANNGQLQVRQWIVNATEAVGFESLTAFTSYDVGDSYTSGELDFPMGRNVDQRATIAFKWRIPDTNYGSSPSIFSISSNGTTHDLNFRIINGKLAFVIGKAGTWGSYLTSNVALPTNSWINVVAGYGGYGSASSLIINGQSDNSLTGQNFTVSVGFGTGTLENSEVAGPFDICIGGYDETNPTGYGDIKDIKIYRGIPEALNQVDSSSDTLPAGTSEVLFASRNGSGLDNNLGVEFTAAGTPAIHEVESQSLANVDPALLGEFGRGVVMSPDESLIAISGDSNYPLGYVQVYEYNNYEIGQPVGSPIVLDRNWDNNFSEVEKAIYGWGGMRVAFSGDNSSIVIGSYTKGVVVFKLVNGEWEYQTHMGTGWGEDNTGSTNGISDVHINSDGTVVWWGQPFFNSSRGRLNRGRKDENGTWWFGEVVRTSSGSFNTSDYYGYSNAIIEEDENTFYAITGSQGHNAGSTDTGEVYVHKSVDKGETWTQIYNRVGVYDSVFDSGGSNTRDKLGQGVTASKNGDNIILVICGQYSHSCIEIDKDGNELFFQKQDLLSIPLNADYEGYSNLGVITKSNQLVLPYRYIVSKWDLVPNIADRTDGFMFVNNEVQDLLNEDTTTDVYHYNRMFISDLSGLIVYGDPANNNIFTSKFAWLPAVYQSGNSVLTDQSELPFVLSADQFALAYDSSIVPAETQQTVNAGTTAFFNEPTRAAQGFDNSFAIYRNTEHPDNMKFLDDGTIQFAAPGGYPHSAVGGYIESAYAGSPLYTSDTHLQTPKSGYVWFKPQRVLNGINTSSNDLQILFNDAFYFSTANTPENGGVMFEISGYNYLSTASYIGRLFSPIEATWLTGQDDYGMNSSFKMHECRIYKSEYPEYVFEDWHLLVWAVQNTVDGDVARSRLNVWFDGQYYNQTRIYHYANSQPYSGIRPYRYNNKASDGIYVGARSYYSGSTHVNGRNFQGLVGDFKVYVNRYFDLNDAGQIWETTKAKYGK